MGKLGKVILGLVMAVCLCIAVSAAQVCGIEVELPGGSLTLYRVDGTFSGTAQEMADRAAENSHPGITKTLQGPGTVRFDGLEPGRYLLVQREAAEGYLPVVPFVVELSGDSPEIHAKPKWEKAPEDPQTPDTGDRGIEIAAWTAGVSFLLLIAWLLRHRRKGKV